MHQHQILNYRIKNNSIVEHKVKTKIYYNTSLTN